MKQFCCITVIVLICVSCVDNVVDSQYIESGSDNSRNLYSIMRRSMISLPIDTLAMMSMIQSDINTLMMSRVVKVDSVFVLALKKEDAEFLGVTEDVYEKYLDYVEKLNYD